MLGRWLGQFGTDWEYNWTHILGSTNYQESMSLLRRLTVFPFGMSGLPCRAPKKKGQAEVVIQSSGDVTNIFKDRTQQVIRPITDYPLFMQYYNIGIDGNFRGSGGIRQAAMEGDVLGHPHPPDRLRFLAGLKRQYKKLVNKRKHIKTKYLNADKSSLTPEDDAMTFPDPFAELRKYQEEQRKRELEEQLALDDESEEEDAGKGGKRK